MRWSWMIVYLSGCGCVTINENDLPYLQAIAKQGWEKPTLIQEKAIPLLLEGKDVLIRARTGSGKTGAFAIPAIQKILNSKLVAREQAVKCLILAPSKELCHQIYTNILQLTIKCSREVTCVDISAPVDLSAQQSLLTERPDIVVATPSRALAHLKAGNIDLKKSLEVLVIDEADLVFSFGYEDELKQIFRFLPRIYQATLASATLSEDVLSLKKLVLHNAVTLKLEESELAPATQLSHYHLAAEEEDKAAILYALLKLHLIRGKTVIFVNSVDRCYSKRKKDKESGVSRGIDFQYVSNVINFDFPLDVNSYIHRAGRTARGTNQGTALSFVSIKERPLMQEVEQFLQKSCGDNNNILKAYQFKLEQVEGFRYRAKDAWRAVTRIAVREARLKEIKQEILNSQKLKSYFVDNPRDLQTLRHDKALHTVKIQPHLADVPDYIVPDALKQLSRVSTSRKKNRLGSSRNNLAGVSKAKAKYEAKKANPLKSMEFFGFKKRKTS
ncbi:probable ATP-dependent RNA helicase DDX56 isoform X4 [Schistocerca piceifrons]|uniref:probable ATP-dependent RNA helicase DDX56 isoform X4 n=1 Tax=Schistocerca piceifrons TaxID=274613 RepID=UPI001F5F5221|nr:probable ATP-dependent RNA helicase DDX56 isoform X4 [Schistocerca piceifrons]